MADAFLIETMSVNPYDWIIANTDSQIADINNQIQLVSNEINKLEASNPTSPTLSQLRERLSSLQSKKEWLTSTNESAKSLSQSFNQWQQNVNTLKWIYDIKQQELEKARAEDEKAYMQMIEDTRRDNQNYINALWNATASENAIINANAWRQWASEQSTSEARARNYLNNAQTQAEAANNARATINNLEQARMNSNQWYTQLSQSNADNYLRQQVLADMEAAENEKTRQAQYWNSYWGWGSRWTSSRWTNNIFDPYSLVNKNKNNNNNNNNNNNSKDQPQDISEYEKELQKAKEEAEIYGKWNGNSNMFIWIPDTRVLAWSMAWMQNTPSLDTTYIPKVTPKEPEPVKSLNELDRAKINTQMKNSWLDPNTITYQLTDKWYVMFRDWKWNTKYVDANSLRK